MKKFSKAVVIYYVELRLILNQNFSFMTYTVKDIFAKQITIFVLHKIKRKKACRTIRK